MIEDGADGISFTGRSGHLHGSRHVRPILACTLTGLALASLAGVARRWAPQADVQASSARKADGAVSLAEAGHSKKAAGTKLLCFSVSMTMGYEVDLVKAQYEQKSGIFACDTWVVYSIDSFKLGPRDNTTAIPGQPAIWNPQSGDGVSVFNTEVFLRAWDKINEAKLYQDVDWVVKADIDTVFFPDRLRKELSQESWSWVTKWNGAAFIKNCYEWNSMQGPLEILSRVAVEKLLEGMYICKSSIATENTGEDQYLDQCLEILGVQGVASFNVLSDFYCHSMPKPCDCKNAGHEDSSAFHPCKSVDSYFECAREALARGS